MPPPHNIPLNPDFYSITESVPTLLCLERFLFKTGWTRPLWRRRTRVAPIDGDQAVRIVVRHTDIGSLLYVDG